MYVPNIHGKTEHKFQSRLCTCSPTQTTKQPIYLSYLHIRIKKCLMGHGITEAYAPSTYYTFCYRFCLTVQPRIINISNVCLTRYRLTVMIRIREICAWSKTMPTLTIQTAFRHRVLIDVCTRDWATMSLKT